MTIEEIVQRFITELESQGLKYEAYFKMSLATSMRRSEACSLQWSDSRCCISVSASDKMKENAEEKM